jgi:hypothetical protein
MTNTNTQTPKQDKQGRSYYTIEQVKQMAEDRGLPCRMIGDAVHPATLEPLSLSRVWRRYYPHDYATGRSTYSNIPEVK